LTRATTFFPEGLAFFEDPPAVPFSALFPSFFAFSGDFINPGIALSRTQLLKKNYQESFLSTFF
jgi:hypothetical protein